MPLFYEHAASAAIVKHGITVQTKAIQFLNPGQIPVIAFDAPLFALAKFVQWKWPDMHGEDKCVAMMGGLHIEMALWSSVGDYLDGSGWVTALTQSGVASTGTAANLELSGLIFVRAHRERNFPLYLDCIKAITPWFFALDHYHYARWMPVHIHDMQNLPTSIYNEFYENGHWVIQKTKNRFSAMSIDQAHEHNRVVLLVYYRILLL